MNFLFLLLLGLVSYFTYFIVQRSVAGITRTPVWLLWLVLMTPTLIWSVWAVTSGGRQAMPTALVIWPPVICLLLYWFLIQWGRIQPNPSASEATNPSNSDQSPQPEAESSRVAPISKAEESKLRNCFPWSVYFLQHLEYRPQAILCRGQLRSDPDLAYKTIQENVIALFGDRFLVLFQVGLNNQPFFALVPNPTAHPEGKRQRQKVTRPGLALGLLLATLLTTTLAGTLLANVSRQSLNSNPALLLQGLPYALSLMAILGIHEMGHYVAAQFHKIRTTLPYFIPVPPEPFFIGTFGAFIQMRSPVPNRKSLFDVGIAGPIAGFIITLPLLIWGLAHSEVVPLSSQSGMLNFHSLTPKSSLLLALLSKTVLGSALTASQAIDLHPVAIAGYLGLLLTAFNLMPVGQLDGGHIVHAMFGQGTAIAIGQVARFLMLLLYWVQRDGNLLFWAIILLVMPIADEPALNDVSELDNQRDIWGLLALALLLLILLPAPRFVTQLLNL